MPETPDFDQIARTMMDDFMASLKIRPEPPTTFVSTVAVQLRQVWNARGQADRERIGEIIGDQREPDYSLRMAQESIKTLDR